MRILLDVVVKGTFKLKRIVFRKYGGHLLVLRVTDGIGEGQGASGGQESAGVDVRVEVDAIVPGSRDATSDEAIPEPFAQPRGSRPSAQVAQHCVMPWK